LRDFEDCGRRAVRWMKHFIRHRGANTAMIFALATTGLVASAGAGIDLSRAVMARTRLSEALDAAALAIGTTSGWSQADLQAMAQKYFDANYPPDSVATAQNVQVAVNGQAIDMSVSGSVPTTLLKVIGIDNLNIGVSNEVVRSVTKLHVALALDNTGSMTQADSTGTTKIDALKTATHQLLTQLKNAAVNDGDVQVGLVPFSLDVKPGSSNVNETWVSWTDFDSAPPNSTPSSSVGPGSNCPYGSNTSPYGYRCTTSPSNGASTTNTIPSSGSYKGYICPGMDGGTYNSGRGGHYYNGCYNSVPTRTSTQTCTQVGNNSPSCSTTVTNGYTGDSTNTSSSASQQTVCSGWSCSCTGYSSCSCSGSGSSTVCKANVTTTTTVTATGTGPWNHTWVANDHSTWSGCAMDRAQNYDTTNTTPTTGTPATLFPAENNAYCPPGTVEQLGFDWTALNNAVDAMTANGSTNQTIGFVWGWQALTQGAPLNAPAADSVTQNVIILLSDGLNTQDRWYGNGFAQNANVDMREETACDNAKAAGVIIYTLFVDLNGTSGNSAPLQYCASDSNKYFDLTTSGQIVTAFNTIGTQLANLHLSK
jgi:Flp pilus assembly protein TadG